MLACVFALCAAAPSFKPPSGWNALPPIVNEQVWTKGEIESPDQTIIYRHELASRARLNADYNGTVRGPDARKKQCPNGTLAVWEHDTATLVDGQPGPPKHVVIEQLVNSERAFTIWYFRLAGTPADPQAEAALLSLCS